MAINESLEDAASPGQRLVCETAGSISAASKAAVSSVGSRREGLDVIAHRDWGRLAELIELLCGLASYGFGIFTGPLLQSRQMHGIKMEELFE